MNDGDGLPGASCCDSAIGCVFAKALLARAAVCELAHRRALAEREMIECPSPVARTNCGTLAALLHERARFALRLPAPGQPLIHAQALRLQCGGLQALREVLSVAEPAPDVHRMVGVVHERQGSLTLLPWGAIVQHIVQWQPHRARRTSPR